MTYTIISVIFTVENKQTETMTTQNYTFTRDGRRVKTHVPTKTEDQVYYFFGKYCLKMLNSLPSTAAWWIDGISELTTKQKQEVWAKIQEANLTDTDSRDRAWEHNDKPNWIS